MDVVWNLFWLSHCDNVLSINDFACNVIQYVYFYISPDLENFKTQTVRSAVNVREGQGVVLLCGPPTHSGGKIYTTLYTQLFMCCVFVYDCAVKVDVVKGIICKNPQIIILSCHIQ